MKRLSVLFLLFTSSLAFSTELQFKSLFFPLYVQNAYVDQTEDVHAKPREIRVISRGAEPETTLAYLNNPFLPAFDETWHEAKVSKTPI